MHTTTLLTVLVIVLTFIITVAGTVGAWSAFRTKRDLQTAKLYQDTAEGWRKKSEMQDSEIADLQRQNADQQAHIEAQDRMISDLNGQLRVLKDVVTGKAAIEQLAGEFRDSVRTIIEEIQRNRQVYIEHLETQHGKPA